MTLLWVLLLPASGRRETARTSTVAAGEPGAPAPRTGRALLQPRGAGHWAPGAAVRPAAGGPLAPPEKSSLLEDAGRRAAEWERGIPGSYQARNAIEFSAATRLQQGDLAQTGRLESHNELALKNALISKANYFNELTLNTERTEDNALASINREWFNFNEAYNHMKSVLAKEVLQYWGYPEEPNNPKFGPDYIFNLANGGNQFDSYLSGGSLAEKAAASGGASSLAHLGTAAGTAAAAGGKTKPGAAAGRTKHAARALMNARSTATPPALVQTGSGTGAGSGGEEVGPVRFGSGDPITAATFKSPWKETGNRPASVGTDVEGDSTTQDEKHDVQPKNGNRPMWTSQRDMIMNDYDKTRKFIDAVYNQFATKGFESDPPAMFDDYKTIDKQNGIYLHGWDNILAEYSRMNTELINQVSKATKDLTIKEQAVSVKTEAMRKSTMEGFANVSDAQEEFQPEIEEATDMLDEKLFGLLDGIKETDPNTGVRAFSPGLVQYEQNATKELLAARDVFDLKMEDAEGDWDKYTTNIYNKTADTFAKTEDVLESKADSTLKTIVDWEEALNDDFAKKEAEHQVKVENAEKQLEALGKIVGKAQKNMTDSERQFSRDKAAVTTLETDFQTLGDTTVQKVLTTGLEGIGKTYNDLSDEMKKNMSTLLRRVEAMDEALDKGVTGNISILKMNWTQTMKEINRDFSEQEQKAKSSLEDTATTRESLSDAREVMLKLREKLDVMKEAKLAVQKDASKKNMDARKLASTETRNIDAMTDKAVNGLSELQRKTLRAIQAAVYAETLQQTSTFKSLSTDAQVASARNTDRVAEAAQKMVAVQGDLQLADGRLQENVQQVTTFPAYVRHMREEIVTGAEEDRIATETMREELGEHIKTQFDGLQQEVLEMQELMHGNLEDMTAKEQERGAKLIASMAKNVTDLASQIDDDIMAYDGRERNVRDTVTGLLYSTGNFTAAAQRFAADRLANVSAVIAKVDDELQREREAKSALVNKAKQSAEASSNEASEETDLMLDRYQLRFLQEQERLSKKLALSDKEARQRTRSMRESVQQAVLGAAMGLDRANGQIGMFRKLLGSHMSNPAVLNSLGAIEQLMNATKKLQTEGQNININGANMRYMLGLLLSEAQKREDATLAGLAGKLGDVSGGVGKLLFDQSDTFRTQVAQLEGGAETAGRSMMASEERDREALRSADRQVLNDASVAATTYGNDAHRVMQDTNNAINELAGMATGSVESEKRLEGEVSDVFREMHRGQSQLERHFAQVEGAALDEIRASLDTKEVTEEEAKRIVAAETLANTLLELEQKAAGHAGDVSEKLNYEIGTQLESVAKNVGGLMGRIVEQRQSVMKAVENVDSTIDTAEGGVRRGVQEVHDAQKEFVREVEARERKVQYELQDLHVQLEDMAALTEYAGPETINDIIGLVNNAMVQDDQLQQQVSFSLEPQTKHWREGVGTILERFGLGIDYDEILARAQEQFFKEVKLRNAMAEANGEVTTYMRHAQRVAEKALESEARKLDGAIADIMSNSEMDASEKAAAIRKLREEAEENRKLMLEKARLIAESQQAAGLSLEQQEALLNTLVERAKMAKRHAKNPPSREALAAEGDKAQQGLDRVRTALSPGSLLQVGTTRPLVKLSDDDDAIDALVPNLLTAPATAEAALDEREAEWHTEGAEWEHELDAELRRRHDKLANSSLPSLNRSG